MFHPSGGSYLSVEAISGVCGSVSIACWVVVFSPQIIENFRRSSAEGLSVEFIIIWLLGDVFNILGAVLQGVLPTMIILAIYYTFADIVLLGQYFYYKGFVLRDPRPDKNADAAVCEPSERSPLIQNGHTDTRSANAEDFEAISRYPSPSSFRNRLASLDGSRLSPALPIHPRPSKASETEALKPSQPRSWTKAILFNSTAIVLVVLAGVAGYFLSSPTSGGKSEKSLAGEQAESLGFSVWGQIFGYICAVLYLGSRVPQLLLNYRRKSTEGLNALFFLFACFGNLTYVLSIFAFAPICSQYSRGDWIEQPCRPGEAGAIYGRYILVNLSWLIGSLGTLFLDFAVFAQFWVYREGAPRELAGTSVVDGDARGRAAADR